MHLLRLIHGGDAYWARWFDEATARLWTAAPWEGGQETDRLVPLRPERLLPPVQPSKIVCVGRNYKAHARELGQDVPPEPLLFLKPASALLAPGGHIEHPADSDRVEHEGELGVVIGSRLRHASAEQALGAVFGITCVNDVTARDLQRKDVQFTRSKSFDTFCPCGPWITTDLDPQDRTIVVRVNDRERQRASTRDMLWPVASLLSFISRVMTLEAGDLVCTGTPEGVGPLRDGDRVEVEIDGVGVLASSVRPDQAATAPEVAQR